MRTALCILFLVLLGTTLLAQSPTPPPAPTDLAATVVQGIRPEVELTWTDSIGPWVYKVHRSADDTTDFHTIAQVPALEFTDHQVQPGTTYYYFITAAWMGPGQHGESGPSNIVSVTVEPPPPPVQGAIDGTVTDDSTGLPLRHIGIRFLRAGASWNWCAVHVETDSLGQYHAVLDTGTYLVKAEPRRPAPGHPAFVPEYYDNVTSAQDATPVTVTDGSVFVANFGLAHPVPPTLVTVSGTVTDSLGAPIAHAYVAIMRSMQQMASIAATTGQTPGLGIESVTLDGTGHARGVVWRGMTDSLGAYAGEVIADADYIALATAPGFYPEYYNNQTNPANADIIHPTVDLAGVDFSLSTRVIVQYGISGSVVDSLGTGVPARVLLIPVGGLLPPGNNGRMGHTDSLGVFSLQRVRPGRYFVHVFPFSDYAPAYYKAGAFGVSTRSEADTVDVTGEVTGITVGVVPIQSNGIARMGGNVVSAEGLPLQGVVMIARNTGGTVLGSTVTDGSGRYLLEGLPAGELSILATVEGYTDGTMMTSIAAGTVTAPDGDFTMTPEVVLSVGPATETPEGFVLRQNYPNPFNPSTTISFTLTASAETSLDVFNVLGQHVATLLGGQMDAGTHRVMWDGRNDAGHVMPSGLYFYRLQSGTSSTVKSMMLLK